MTALRSGWWQTDVGSQRQSPGDKRRFGARPMTEQFLQKLQSAIAAALAADLSKAATVLRIGQEMDSIVNSEFIRVAR